MSNRIFAALSMALILALAGCGSQEPLATSSASALPAYVQSASVRVQQAYQFAVANSDVLAYQPCYCGCGAMGHTSNLDCYIRDVAGDGTITFNSHAAGCGICVDITQDVMRLLHEGRSQTEVRAYIDAQYSPFGPSTETLLPPQQ